MKNLVCCVEDIGAPSVLHSFSALDTYYDSQDTKILHVFTEADLIELSRVFDNLQYPGVPRIDAVAALPEGEAHIMCIDSVQNPPLFSFDIMNLLYDPSRMVFVDSCGMYGELREKVLRKNGQELQAEHLLTNLESWDPIVDAAILLSRMQKSLLTEEQNAELRERVAELSLPSLSIFQQRYLLIEMLSGKNPKAGFELLRQFGFIDSHWPELTQLYEIAHTKEHHPEGNVWQHTLETFSYRKTSDLALSLGLLFHDSGKPEATQNEGRMFDKHSQIGARIAVRFLHRLEFEQTIIDQVRFLVREHMLPTYLSQLPTFRTEKVMSNTLFPILLELYRCDLSSTYRGPDGYYSACKVYRSFLKNVRNPYRTSDGKKILRMYVEGR